MTQTLVEACVEAAGLSAEMDYGNYTSRYYCLEGRHIGTGAWHGNEGRDHMIFEFNGAPESGNVAALIVVLADFSGVDNYDNAGQIGTLRNEVREVGEGVTFADNLTADQVTTILNSVLELDCMCSNTE